VATKSRPKAPEFEPELFEDYDDDYDYDYDDDYEDSDDLDDEEEVSKVHFRNKREDTFESIKRMSVRRRIERRNELKELYAQIDDWNTQDIAIDW
jgi:hypothetical protein